jgi:glycerol-1-phosphate dehydrogenase [NAD(P)+]
MPHKKKQLEIPSGIFKGLVISFDGRTMKEPKRMELPREVWMGPHVLKHVAEVCKKLEFGKRALIISDSTTLKLAGEDVRRSLKRVGFDSRYMLIKEADIKTVKNVQKLAEKKKIDFLLGVGGGRCIDIAKLASFYVGRPFVSIPTAASHDGMASSRASIKGGKKPTSIEAHTPIAVIADTLIIKRAPHRLLAAGCGDLAANLTAVKDW